MGGLAAGYRSCDLVTGGLQTGGGVGGKTYAEGAEGAEKQE